MIRIRHLAIHLAVLTEDVASSVDFHTNAFGLQIVGGVGTASHLTGGNPTDLSQRGRPH